ncbi:hypothetical protein MTBPR1_290002 [Candidatus Terasakiella magnetica]|uniref:Uncharacterized protein n=1 Tax=Candidatus Terasakiella magnetica TaxID=1867952 RepID=A0A1C3RH88_9PROT|nr:hypothetical protein [Candidatus Terasakiella magnetica]SCA56628.1 hypothetical protein MTBPR1_290002 [Candidatus Terasakiella magnetica]
MMKPEESLDLTLGPCEAPKEDILDLADFLHELFEFLNKTFEYDHGILLIRMILEIVKCRSEGVNPDISMLAERMGVSRNTIKRMDTLYREKNPDIPDMIPDGRRMVYAYKELSDPSVKMVDHIMTLWNAKRKS